MSLRSLLLHDVAARQDFPSTGFASPGADVYKVERELFDRYLHRIEESEIGPPARVTRGSQVEAPNAWALTVDDGGVTSATEIAPRLDALGWKGHFFITTELIGSPGFVDRDQIRRIRAAGHVIGTHTRSHPRRISTLDYAEIVEEWRTSRNELTHILGEPVHVGSVPGGFYSLRVAAAAGEAGIEILFTSEPTARPRNVDGCLVLGRYSIKNGMSADEVVGLAEGRTLYTSRQWIGWNAKKVAKAIGGDWYSEVRSRLLSRRRSR